MVLVSFLYTLKTVFKSYFLKTQSNRSQVVVVVVSVFLTLSLWLHQQTEQNKGYHSALELCQGAILCCILHYVVYGWLNPNIYALNFVWMISKETIRSKETKFRERGSLNCWTIYSSHHQAPSILISSHGCPSLTVHDILISQCLWLTYMLIAYN